MTTDENNSPGGIVSFLPFVMKKNFVVHVQ